MVSKKEYENSTSKKDWLELFTDSSNRRSLIILIFANIFLQCSGIVSIVLFSGIIINMAGISLDPSIAMIIILFCQLGGSMLVPFFIEKCGRRFLMIVSCIICSFCMVSIFTFFVNFFVEIDEIELNTAFCVPGGRYENYLNIISLRLLK